jgi:hypothetical protein
MKLSAQEEQIWWMYKYVRGYPRWRKTTCGFLLYIHPDAWVEAVSPTLSGNWVTGRQSEGTEKTFTHLQDALSYGELLNLRREISDLKFSPEYASLCNAPALYA